MKRKYVFTALAVLSLALTGCLDKSPIDPNIEQTFDAQKIDATPAIKKALGE